jgi:CHAT domain-containing protein
MGKIYAFSSVSDSFTVDRMKDSAAYYKEQGIKQAKNGEFKEAKKSFLKELAFKQNHYSDSHPRIANTYVNLGVVFKMEGKLDKALQYYKQAESIYAKNPHFNPRKTGTNLQNMGNIYNLQRDYEKAENYYQQAIDLFKHDSLNNLDRLGMVYNNLGITHKNQNELKKAIECYKKSIQYKHQKNQCKLYITMGNLANVFRLKKNYEQAEKYFHESIKYAIEHYGEYSHVLDNHYLNYGVMKMETGNYDKGEKLIKKSLEISIKHLGKKNPETAMGYENLGYLYFLKKDYRQALHYYQKALIALSESFNDTTNTSNPKVGEVFSKPQLVNILKNKASTFKKIEKNRRQNLEAALSCYELALEVIKELRTGYQNQESKLLLTANERTTFLNTIKTAISLYHLTQEQKYIEKAFRYAETSKAAVLYEAMQSNQALKFGSIPDSLVKKEQRLKKDIWTFEELIFEERKKRETARAKINFWKEKLFTLNRAYDELIQKFEKQYPKYYTLKYEQSPINIHTIQQKMEKENVLVEYVLSNNEIYAFTIEKNDFNLKTLAIDSNFTDQVLELRNFLSARDFSNHSHTDFNQYNQQAFDLYTTLLEPLNLPKNKKLTIIPDDILSYLPFEILVTKDETFDRINYNELAYLVKDREIGYSYSAKVLFNHLNKDRDPEKKLAAFAPTYKNIDNVTEFKTRTRQEYREKLYPLKGIKKEARQITEIIPGDAFTDMEATEDTFKSQSGNYDILHLAMHTLVNDEEPMYSKMAFTQKDFTREDGFLNTYEIYNLNLDSRMAVLSSCNTGSGKLQKGEGVISLARGFKYAGCPSIVMTMWPVEDNSSIRLMEYFYQAISKGMSKDQALRHAKLKFLENSDPLHAHPYFWAGYILIGDKTALYKPSYTWLIVAGGILVLLILAGSIILRKKLLR